MSLIDQLIESGYLKSENIIEAFKKVERVNFLPEEYRDSSELNRPLPIGYQQTNSEPLVVAFMLEELDVKLDQTVLDVGSGSGWVTALLAELVGDNGKVVAVEIVNSLCKFGRSNVLGLNYMNVDFRCGDWEKVVLEEERFDRIHAACASPIVPLKMKIILKENGKIVMPIEHDRWGDHSVRTITKLVGGQLKEKDHPGFMFVPMLNN